MRMKILYLILLISFSCSLQGQIDGDAFIKNSIDGLELTTQRDFDFIQPSLIEELDFRTESRDFEPNKQEYTFRVKPSTPKKIKAQKELAEHILNEPDFAIEEWKCDVNQSAHESWIDLYIKSIEIEKYENIVSIYDDKKIVLDRLETALTFDFNEKVKLERDRSEALFFIEKTKLDLKTISKDYGFDEDADYSFKNFMSIDQIKNQILGHKEMESSLSEDAYEQELIKKEIDLEEAEKKQFIDFAQVRYQGPHDNSLDERVSIGLAFTLNTSGTKNLKIKQLGLELERLTNKVKREELESSIELSSLKLEILRDIEALSKYQVIHQKEKERLEKISEMIANKNGSDPQSLLSIKERIVRIEIEEIGMKENIYFDFLDFKRKSGGMCLLERNLLHFEP